MDNNYRILVVDDEQDLCEILKFNLETDGYTCHKRHPNNIPHGA